MSEAAARQTTVRWIVWAAMLASLGVYAVLPSLMPAPPATGDTGAATRLALPIAMIALALGVSSVALRRLLLLGPIQRGALDPSSEAGALRVTQIAVVSWALAESVGVLGLVLALLAGTPGYAWGFAGAAAALLGSLAPRALPVPGRRAAERARPGVQIG